MEKPSARRFANPMIKTIEAFNEAPTTPETTAKVVIEPSIPPRTISGRYFRSSVFIDSPLLFIKQEKKIIYLNHSVF